MDINNEATGVYEFNGSGEQNTVTSNTNTVVLENAQGLNLTKTATPSEFVAGDIITYTITITNTSASYLNGVRIIDNIGGGNLAYVVGSARLTIGTLTYAVNPIATNPLTFTLQQLNVGATMTLTYRCQVIFNLPSTVNSITNTVQGIGYTSTGTIVGFANATITRMGTSEFSLSKTSSVTNVFPRQPLSYFLTLTNNTDTTATAISVTDQLPANFVVTSINLRIGSNASVTLGPGDYSLSGTNFLTVPSVTGPIITVPANGVTVITINGYFN